MSIRKADDYEDELLSFNNKRKRMNLSLLQKREIIQHFDDYPTLSQEKIAEHFSSKFKLNQKIGRSTVCELMKNRAKYEPKKHLTLIKIKLISFIFLNNDIFPITTLFSFPVDCR